jgi:hypothetical protein
MDTTPEVTEFEFTIVAKTKLAELETECAALLKERDVARKQRDWLEVQNRELKAECDGWRKVAKEYEARLIEENLL